MTDDAELMLAILACPECGPVANRAMVDLGKGPKAERERVFDVLKQIEADHAVHAEFVDKRFGISDMISKGKERSKLFKERGW